MEKPKFVLAMNIDRYNIEQEASVLEALPDLDIELRTAVCRTEDDVIELAKDADALLISTRAHSTRRVFENLRNCKVIGSYGVGLDHIDLKAATDLGIIITHAPHYCTNEVADHAMALILSLNRHIVQLNHDLHQGAWLKKGANTQSLLTAPLPALRESTLGIIGLGRIGSAVARRAQCFGLTILAADPNVDTDTAQQLSATLVSQTELLQRSDIVTLHTPLTPTTRGLINADAFALMKPSAFLVNTSRGPVVDLDAAIDALTNGKIAGAALDVVYPEPLPMDSPLYGLSNVILTPHSAYYSERSIQRVRTETLDAVLDVLRGRRPPTVANPDVLDRVKLAPPATA